MLYIYIIVKMRLPPHADTIRSLDRVGVSQININSQTVKNNTIQLSTSDASFGYLLFYVIKSKQFKWIPQYFNRIKTLNIHKAMRENVCQTNISNVSK